MSCDYSGSQAYTDGVEETTLHGSLSWVETKQKLDLSDEDGKGSGRSVAAHQCIRQEQRDETKLQQAHDNL